MTGTQSIALRLLLTVAIGLCGYGGYQWYQVDMPDEESLRLSVEANLEADLARMRAQAEQRGAPLELSQEWKDKHRRAIRQEIETMVEREREKARSWFLAGLALLIFSLGRMFAQPLLRRGRDGGKGGE